jgi:hypothetical protein
MKKLAMIVLMLAATTASASVFLNSFNSGRLGKDMKVRHDLDRTHMGSETLENILIRPQGMAYKRPGTEYIASIFDGFAYFEEVPEVPAVPPANQRPEAYVAANNVSVLWWDIDWNLLSEEFLGGGTVCASIAVDPNGIVAAGFGKVGAQVSCIRRWDLDLNADDTFFVPDAGWNFGDWIGDLEFSDDAAYLYAVGRRSGNIQGTGWKFDAKTGDMIYEYYFPAKPVGRWVVEVDEANGYWYTGEQGGGNTKYRRNTSDAAWVSETNNIRGSGLIYDSEDDRIYGCGGVSAGTYKVVGEDWGGGNRDSFRTTDTGTMWNMIKVGEFIYTTGDIMDSNSVWKFSESLLGGDGWLDDGEYQKSYNTGTNCLGIVETWDGDIAVYSAKITILDTDLNLISDYAIPTTVQPIYGPEIQRIPPNMDDGTPGVPGVPAGIYHKDFGTSLTSTIRLIPHEYSTNDATVLEFGHLYIGFLRTVQ